MTIKELDQIITVAVVIGEGAKREYEKSGVRGLYEGSVVAPSRWRIKVMDFLREEVLKMHLQEGKEILPVKSIEITNPYDLGGDGKVYRPEDPNGKRK
ncbi:MAG: hypothetical protein MJY97_01435 [Bacteroidales bacterium]|nr:hypothetical protein [Bacteroidales bacterium]